MDVRAAVGFRVDTAVTLGGRADAPRLLDRRTVAIRDGEPYHWAATKPLPEARKLVARYERAARSRTVRGLQTIVRDIAPARIVACGVVLGTFQLPAFEAILRSHVACHAAEGEMTREAAMSAGRTLGLPIVGTTESDLEATLPPGAADYVRALGREAGPPWRKDERFAAMAAWVALRAQR